MSTTIRDSAQEPVPGETTVIFVQAAADLAYALTICRAAAERGAAVVLSVVLVRSLYEFLCTIPLDRVEIRFIPYPLQPMPRTPSMLFRAYRELSSQWESLTAGRSITEVYFFCTESDAVTPYFLRRFSKRARLFFVDHYVGLTYQREKRWVPELVVKRFLLWLATGVSFGFCLEDSLSGSNRAWRTSFDATSLGALRVDIEPSLSCFPLPVTSKSPLVILMDGNDESVPTVFRYPGVVTNLLADLKARDINVLLKCHPRVGCSQFLKGFDLPSLPAGCPLELFDLGGVTAVIGINSLGLAAAAKLGHTAVSILYLIGVTNEEYRVLWREWLDLHSGGKVLFPRSYEEAIAIAAGVRHLTGDGELH